MPRCPLSLALLDFVDLRALADFFEELFLRAADSLAERFFEVVDDDFFEPAPSAERPNAPKQTIAASGIANLKILITSNNRTGGCARSCSNFRAREECYGANRSITQPALSCFR